MIYRPIPLHSLHKTEGDIILNVKSPMYKILRFKQDEREKQAPKYRFHTYHQFSFASLNVLSNDMKSQKLISNLKKLKSLKHLTIDLVDLLQIPEHNNVHTIFNNLRYVKNLSVLHFQLKDLSFPLHEANLQAFCKALKEINKLLKVQVRLSVSVPIMTHSERERLSVLLENLRKLDRFTFLSLAFRSSQDFTLIRETIQILKASKSLARFSLTLEKCELCPCVRLHELFLIIKDIKLLKCFEILLKECDLPDYNRLRSIFPFLEEVGQNANVAITFEDYRLEMTRYERLLFNKFIQNLKSPRKIQVRFIENFRVARELKSSCLQFLTRPRGAFVIHYDDCPAFNCRIFCILIILIPIIGVIVAVSLSAPKK